MTAARVIRFVLGVILAAILLMVVLPYVGIPSSHYLPPGIVWGKAQRETGNVTHGTIVTKYYDVTNNPFDVGGRFYFIDYQFKGKVPPAKGAPVKASPTFQTYNGTVRVPKDAYDKVPTAADQQAVNEVHENTKIPVKAGQFVRVQYELTYPYINGVIFPDALNGRNIGEGSGNFTGWLLWVLAALALGYFMMLLLERFAHKENL